jgi:hypothetical protein
MIDSTPERVPASSGRLSKIWEFITEYKWILVWTTLFFIILNHVSFIQAAIGASLIIFWLFIAGDFFGGLDEEEYAYRFDPVLGAMIIAAIVFLLSWAVCTAQYGFLLGFGFGWVPSGILAYLFSLMWRVVTLAVTALAVSLTLTI